MAAAPWRMFKNSGGEILIDVEGEITINGTSARPFPCEVTHAAVCDSGLVATWVDHELRMARMALLPADKKPVNGISRSDLRISSSNVNVAGSIWSHSLDAEPIALASNGEMIVFALYTRGIYCINNNSEEIWRQPLQREGSSNLPGTNTISKISIDDEHVIVWTRGGINRTLSLETGEMISETQLNVECDIENVFSFQNRSLITSRDGWAWDLLDGEIQIARKLRGTIQDAVYHNGEWRIISWREDLIFSQPDVFTRAELGVQLIIEDNQCLVLDNQGEITRHMGE